MHTFGPDPNPFERCLDCGTHWRHRDDFLADPYVSLRGYQFFEGDPLETLFLFRHDTEKCFATIAIKAEEFAGLHWMPVFGQRLEGTAQCPRLCMKPSSFEPCPEPCEGAFIRNVLDLVNRWPKHRECVGA